MSANRFEDKNEKATPLRRAKARAEGQVVKSLDLNSAAMLTLGFVALFMSAPFMAKQMMNIMRMAVSSAPQITVAEPSYAVLAGEMVIKFVLLLGPLFAVLILTAVAVNVAQVGFKITAESIRPNLNRLNPYDGFKRVFSTRSLVHALRDGFKMIVVGLVAYFIIKSEFESFFILADASVAAFAATIGKLSISLGLKLSGIILIIGLADYFYQKFEFEKSIRMSKQEIKDEQKDSEGSQLVKNQARQNYNRDESNN